jgi:hypothetical protein
MMEESLESWTHQEICVAKWPILVCGNKQVAFNLVVLAVRALHQWDRQSHCFHLTTKVRKLLVNRELLHNILDEAKHCNTTVSRKGVVNELKIMRSATSFDVTDPKDRVYGVLGLIKLDGHPIPDYQRLLAKYTETLHSQ